jgi:hypothetical protein
MTSRRSAASKVEPVHEIRNRVEANGIQPDLQPPGTVAERQRDSRNGRLLPRHCQTTSPVTRSIRFPLIEAPDSLIAPGSWSPSKGIVVTVDFGDEVKRYRNCDPDRLVEFVKIGGYVGVCDRYRILRSRHRCLFSIANADDPWVPCDYSPLTSGSPEDLAERLQSHGGFLAGGREALTGLESRQ